MSFYDWLYNFDQKVNAIAWGWPTIILILGAGLVLSIGIKFAQFGHFGHMMKNTIGAIGKAKKTDDKGAVTPFQAVCTACRRIVLIDLSQSLCDQARAAFDLRRLRRGPYRAFRGQLA